MGIPRFYRWVSERYPQINQQISDVSLLPEFDNLYLDLNGIIHQCTHPMEQDMCEELGEAQQIPAIFAYIDRIVSHIIKPKKLLFLAVDGVAPRAKLNQQRSRRFRAGKELYEKNLSLQNEDSDEPKKSLFDSNCITPGTEFMYRLSYHLQYFIRKKLKEDPSWRDLTVIFSGQEVPGEGEHKIVEYIRRTKMQPGYPPNVRHCMYGSDADLMLLGLMTHEPHFTLVREVVVFGGPRKGKDDNAKKIIARQTKEQEWQLVHLSLFRQYLNVELRAEVAWYDMERALDDFIFLTFLLGNDFIPHSPTLDISEDAIALLLDLYRTNLPVWGDYLTEGGVLKHPEHLDDLCQLIGAMEENILTKRADEERKFRERKRYGNGYGRSGSSPTRQVDEDNELDEEDIFEQELLSALALQEEQPADLSHEMVVLSGSPAFQATKWAYYSSKFGLKDNSPDLLMAVKVAYVEALVWCLGYYFQGVPSWSWFYPFHYSPMLSDLTDISSIVAKIKFEKGAPFLPFQQLLSTLPPTSSNLVPSGYQQLMIDPNSPIASFYPIQFEIDMDGKRNAWEGVNVLPFIDASMLLDAIDTYCPDSQLTDAEKLRNRVGAPYKFTYDLSAMDVVPSSLPGVLEDIPMCHSKKELYRLPPLTNFQCALTEGVQIPLAGFPSLYSLQLIGSSLSKIELNCFGTSSRKATLVLAIEPKAELTFEQAKILLGTIVQVNYPNMLDAKVVAVSTKDGYCRGGEEIEVHVNSTAEQRDWSKMAAMEAKRYLSGRGKPGTGGLSIGPITCMLHVVTLQGMITDPVTGAVNKKFGKDEVMIPYQLAITNPTVVDFRFQETPSLSASERFPVGTDVVLIEGERKGTRGIVTGHQASKVTVSIRVPSAEPPFGYAIAESISDHFYPSFVICQKLGIQPSTLGRITGSLLVNPGRYDIGLNMKFKKELTLAGYCRYKIKSPNPQETHEAWTSGDSVAIVGSDTESKESSREGLWEYSDKAFHIILAYQRKFPRVFAALDQLPYSSVYDGATFFSIHQATVKGQLEVIKTWLSQLDIAVLPLVPISSETLPKAAVKAIEKAGDIRVKQEQTTDETVLVNASQLFRSISSNFDLSSSAFTQGPPRLGDRVVNLGARGVPFGLRGTVVASHQVSGCVEVVFDTPFSGGTTLHGLCSAYRGKLVQWSTLLVVSAPPVKKSAKEHFGIQDTSKQTAQAPRNNKSVPRATAVPFQPSSHAAAAVPKVSNPPPQAKASNPPRVRAPNPPQIEASISRVTAPPPPSHEKMHQLINKWAQKEDQKKTALNRDLTAPSNSMAQYFASLQTQRPSAPEQAPRSRNVQPAAAPPPVPTRAPAFQPPLPPSSQAPVPQHYIPTYDSQPQQQRGKPSHVGVKRGSSSGLLVPAQVARSTKSKESS
ncbi:hypothetical protein LEN26_005544 [Aphanomyces euteiches]|nr:hypothetical protein AeMF1_000370 [Aphanomyces euteiches]KAH9137795.1 hypothetical protein LEN26_005544 [Aphanomyces euteiches]KAH9188802.1 hypothetical protein AeNC1_009227 [Aphanomyces euteiches]